MIFDPLYDAFIAWCAQNDLDLFVFDWDWRRRLEDTVTFFVRKFLPFFETRVVAAGLPDPLANFSLVGHSFGGMIVNLILRGNDPIVANLARVITAATPFYGYPGQVRRWFEGDPIANGTDDVFKEDIMEVVTSLPALYTLHYLDEATYRVMQFLLWQTMINIIFGALVAAGLYWIGVPYAALWGGFTAVLRFVPYVGTALSLLMPASLAFATFPGWAETVQTIALFLTLDFVTAWFIEPLVFGRRTGVSAFALLVWIPFSLWLFKRERAPRAGAHVLIW